MTTKRCEWCDGVGYYLEAVPFGHPRFGKLLPCRCTLDREQRAALTKLGDELGGLRDKTFEAFTLDRPLEPLYLYGSLYLRPDQRERMPPSEQKKIREWSVERQKEQLPPALASCRTYAHSPCGWLCLHGAYGAGKSHLAAAVALSRVASCWQVRYRSLPGLLDALKAGFADNSSDAIFQDLLDCDLLVLDDLGAEHFTNWSKDRVFRLLNEREHRATVITSNMHPDDLAPATDIDAQRLMSRIVGNARCVWLPLSDYRRLRSER